MIFSLICLGCLESDIAGSAETIGSKGDWQGRMEPRELLLRKAEFDDWKAMYRNVWSRPETARYMAWQVTTDEEQAKVRIRKTISHQENHDAFLVCVKRSGQAIGFAFQ